jgi:hypothetical protein
MMTHEYSDIVPALRLFWDVTATLGLLLAAAHRSRLQCETRSEKSGRCGNVAA